MNLEESTRLALAGKLLESTVYQEGQPFQPDKRDLLKMKEYKDKGSNPSAMANTVKDINKALSRYFIACVMNWKSAKNAFHERILYLAGWNEFDKYRKIMEDLESQASNYEISDEFKANTGTTEFPIDEKSENYLRIRYSKLYKVLKQNNLEYKVTRRDPTQREMETDDINGCHWVIACTLTVKLPDGEVKDIYLCNDTNESGGSYSVSSSTLNVWEVNQQQLADAFQKLIDEHFNKVEESKLSNQIIDNQDNADIMEQGDIPNSKKRLPRKELALSAGKKFKTPKGNELRISVLTLDTNTTSKKASLYISCYIGDKNYQCHSIEEFCDIYLNN